MADAYTYDASTSAGEVRLLIADIDDSDVSPATARSVRTMLFTDAEIGVFLTQAGDNVNRAAARALYTLAASKALLAQRVAVEGLSRDTNSVAKELRETAAAYDALGKEAEYEPADEIVGQDWTDDAYQQRIFGDALEDEA